MATTMEIARLSPADRLGGAVRRSLPYLPAEARGVVESMLTPASLALIGATLVAWAGSHFFGVGEVVDVILLGVGVITLGFAVFEGSKEFYDFTTAALDARSEADLDQAARHFARAVTLLGISAVQALLLRGQSRAVLARGRPEIYPRPEVGTPPPPGNALRLSRPAGIRGGSLGTTSPYGEIDIARNQSLTEQRLTLYHELVHRYFSPRTGPLRQLRAELSWSAYSRSAMMKYIEEALAEGYGQLRVNGLAQAFGAYRFPLQNGYVTVSQLATEGRAIGTITLGGTIFTVSISPGSIPEPKK
jgi:hypothetical protein